MEKLTFPLASTSRGRCPSGGFLDVDGGSIAAGGSSGNNGTVEWDSGGQLTASGAFTNTGTLEDAGGNMKLMASDFVNVPKAHLVATGPNYLMFVTGELSNYGSLQLGPTSRALVTGDFAQNAGREPRHLNSRSLQVRVSRGVGPSQPRRRPGYRQAAKLCGSRRGHATGRYCQGSGWQFPECERDLRRTAFRLGSKLRRAIRDFEGPTDGLTAMLCDRGRAAGPLQGDKACLSVKARAQLVALW